MLKEIKDQLLLFLQLYIKHRERFEQELKGEFLTIYFIRKNVTKLLKAIYELLSRGESL